jgi:pseudouridine synthase
VADLLRGKVRERLVPVGRLDKDSEGLLLLSNDGDFVNRLTHPRFEHEKTYIVRVAGRWSDDKLRVLRGSVEMPDGYMTRPVPVEVLRIGDDNVHVLGQHSFTSRATQIERVVHHVTPPLQRMERYVSVLVNFVVLPLFAFANAQVRLVGVDLGEVVTNCVTQGVYFGAILGKPIGIILVTLLLVKIGFAKLPRNVTWDQVIAVGIMGSMGFTMSILIAGLAFPDPSDVMAAKCAILTASITSALLGIAFVRVHDAIVQMRSGAYDDEDAEGDEPNAAESVSAANTGAANTGDAKEDEAVATAENNDAKENADPGAGLSADAGGDAGGSGE